MDQKEIDALISQGSVADFNKKQEELLKNLADKATPSPPPATPDEDSNSLLEPGKPETAEEKRGRVMGQLSRVTEEAEAGTNMVMGYLENVLTVVSRQQGFLTDIIDKYAENPSVIDVGEALSFIKDNNTVVEELIFSAMDAFQFQDIGRQKLLKVMYTLAKLNEYLNELLGGDADRNKIFGHKIEKKTLEQDKNKSEVDSIIASFQDSGEGETQEQPAQPEKTVQPEITEAPRQASDSNQVLNNDDIDSLIAEFQDSSN
jgi:hypothetical protein